MIAVTRNQRRMLARANALQPAELWPLSRDHWPPDEMPSTVSRVGVWRSREFLVQCFRDDVAGGFRLTVNRTELGHDGRWVDGITWDELQRVKRECGFGDFWAVECYPPDTQVVNVGNLRHLWLLTEPPSGFGWCSDRG